MGLDNADDARVGLVRGIAARYREQGLLDGDERRIRLSSDCPRHCTCWQGERPALAPAEAAYDAVALPWVGSRYPAERILVVGTNFNGGGGFGAHWDICRSHIQAMRSGRPGHHGRPYAARVMSAVRAIRESRVGTLDPGWRPPGYEELADDWESVAYLQAVKCAPATARSEPFPEMYDACPSLTLMPELDVLRPRVMIVLGRSHVRDAVRPLLIEKADLRWGASPGSLERDTFSAADTTCTLFCLNHPSAPDAGSWRRSLAQLVEQLIAQPLDASPPP